LWFSTTKLAKLEKVTTQTIRNKIKDGCYEKVIRTEGGHYRIFKRENKIIGYARVSSSKQKTSLIKQQEILLKKYPDATIFTDTASAFNFGRKGLCSILEQALSGTSICLVATTQDRIARSGFGFIKRIIELSGGSIITLDDKIDSKEEFNTAELISFITSFCNSYYGKQSARRKNYSNKKNKNISKEY
jgi:predicted site-specific integrase-resolvase